MTPSMLFLSHLPFLPRFELRLNPFIASSPPVNSEENSVSCSFVSLKFLLGVFVVFTAASNSAFLFIRNRPFIRRFRYTICPDRTIHAYMMSGKRYLFTHPLNRMKKPYEQHIIKAEYQIPARMKAEVHKNGKPK